MNNLFMGQVFVLRFDVRSNRVKTYSRVHKSSDSFFSKKLMLWSYDYDTFQPKIGQCDIIVWAWLHTVILEYFNIKE